MAASFYLLAYNNSLPLADKIGFEMIPLFQIRHGGVIFPCDTRQGFAFFDFMVFDGGLLLNGSGLLGRGRSGKHRGGWNAVRKAGVGGQHNGSAVNALATDDAARSFVAVDIAGTGGIVHSDIRFIGGGVDETEVVGRIHIGFHHDTHMANFQFPAAEKHQVAGYQVLFGHFLAHQKHVARTAGQFDAVLSEAVIDEAGAVEMVGTGSPVFVNGGGFLGKGQLDDGVDGGAGDGRLIIDRDGVFGERVNAVVHLGEEGDNGEHHHDGE